METEIIAKQLERINKALIYLAEALDSECLASHNSDYKIYYKNNVERILND